MRERALGKRALFPKTLRTELARLRNGPFVALRNLLSPGKKLGDLDIAFGSVLNLSKVTAKQVRLGNRSLTSEEWDTLLQHVNNLAQTTEGLDDAVAVIRDSEEAFLRPFADENVTPPKRGRKARAGGDGDGDDDDDDTIVLTSPKSKNTAKFTRSDVTLTWNGVTLVVPWDCPATVKLTREAIVFTLPR